MSWTEGFGSKLHTVYFGDNFDDVNNATGGLPQADTTYDPGPLELAKTYYWRADEFDRIETYKGDVWSFTTEGAVAALDPVNGAVDVTQTPVLTWAPGLGATNEVYFGTDAASLEVNYYRLNAVALWLGCKPTKVRHLYRNLRPQVLYPEALYTV